jgi:hypothetical protein
MPRLLSFIRQKPRAQPPFLLSALSAARNRQYGLRSPHTFGRREGPAFSAVMTLSAPEQTLCSCSFIHLYTRDSRTVVQENPSQDSEGFTPFHTPPPPGRDKKLYFGTPPVHCICTVCMCASIAPERVKGFYSYSVVVVNLSL